VINLPEDHPGVMVVRDCSDFSIDPKRKKTETDGPEGFAARVEKGVGLHLKVSLPAEDG